MALKVHGGQLATIQMGVSLPVIWCQGHTVERTSLVIRTAQGKGWKPVVHTAVCCSYQTDGGSALAKDFYLWTDGELLASYLVECEISSMLCPGGTVFRQRSRCCASRWVYGMMNFTQKKPSEYPSALTHGCRSSQMKSIITSRGLNCKIHCFVGWQLALILPGGT
jgi:hypothetical protein